MQEPTIKQSHSKQRVEVLIPDDGGTPRDPACIRQEGSSFHICARREEGRNPLSHAISRVELVLRNLGAQRADVTVAIDLAGGGPAPSSHPRWGAMEERGYVYVRPPNGHWQRADGEIEAWIVTVSLRLEPGDTLLGFSPSYGYGDCLRFVHSLPQTPLLRKTLLAQSDGGREHWALRITDPSVPAGNKLRVLLAARAHAYETFGSFALEGMVRYLLSGAPAANLRLLDFEVLPMLNVDGVALGHEYTQGFEQGPQRDLQASASGRLYFARIDEYRPHVLVVLHNWITPRAWDVISYTDVDEAGHLIDRAQETFRGFFPPQTEFGKGWLNDADEPLTHNWAREDEGAHPNLTNPEVYARLRYRSEVWVPEFPWFGRDDNDPVEIAQETGRKYLRALIQTLVRLHALPGAVREAPEELAWLSNRQPLHVVPAGSEVCRDTSSRGLPIVLDRVVFPHGLTISAGTGVSYDLGGTWETFAAVVSVDGCADAALQMCVEGDGRLLWTSPSRRPGDRRERIELDVRGIRVLTLASGPLADRRAPVQAVWADAKVRRLAGMQ